MVATRMANMNLLDMFACNIQFESLCHTRPIHNDQLARSTCWLRGKTNMYTAMGIGQLIHEHSVYMSTECARLKCLCIHLQALVKKAAKSFVRHSSPFILFCPHFLTSTPWMVYFQSKDYFWFSDHWNVLDWMVWRLCVAYICGYLKAS